MFMCSREEALAALEALGAYQRTTTCDTCKRSVLTDHSVVLIRQSPKGKGRPFVGRCTACLGTETDEHPLIQAIVHP